MTQVRVGCFTISLDGYGAGPRQDLDNPLGIEGMDLRALGYECVEFVASEKATHVVLRLQTGKDSER